MNSRLKRGMQVVVLTLVTFFVFVATIVSLSHAIYK